MSEKVALEGKEVSTTQKFKLHLQAIIQDSLGVKVSQDKAWNLYKDLKSGALQFVVKDAPEMALSLAGVETLEVQKAQVEGKKAGLVPVYEEGQENVPAIQKAKKKDADGKPMFVRDETLAVWPFNPRIKSKESSKLQDMVYAMTGMPGYENTPVELLGIYKARQEEAPAVEAKAEKPAKTPKAPAKAKTSTNTDLI